MSRRRAHQDDDSDSDDGGRSRSKRHRSEAIDIEERLEKLILKVGDKSSASLETNLEGLAAVLEHDIANYKSKIIRILCDVVTGYPEKLTVYTSLVGLLNAKNPTCGGEFIDSLVRDLKDVLKSCQFEKARYMILFMADLVNCHVIDSSSILAFFDNLVEVCLEDNIPQTRSDWYVHTVLYTLPWVGKELFLKKEADFNKILMSVQSYLGKRSKTHLHALKVWTSDSPHVQEDRMDCMWAQIKHLQGNGWTERQIKRPYLAFEGTLQGARQHSLPNIIPPSHHEDALYPLPRVVFRMFDYTDVPDESTILPGSHSIERFLIDEQLHLTLLLNQYERKDCAAALLMFKEEKIPLNYMIIETVFAQMFRLPSPPTVEIFYHSLILELCKLQPSTMPIVLVQATEMLFSRLDSMNTVCIERFVNWLSYHLSNFQFKWTWEEWSEVLKMDPMSPKAMFVRELLTKCLWLSYHKRLVEMCPDDFGPILPAEPLPHFKYLNAEDELPGMQYSQLLSASIKAKCTAEDVLHILKDVPNPLADDEMDIEQSHNPLAIDVFVHTLLNLGAKSFSHSFAAIAKFSSVLKELGSTDEGQLCILKSMYELWSDHQQMLLVLINKMMQTKLLKVSAVANWIFSEEMMRDFTRFYVWDLLHSSIRKMNKQVTQLQCEVEEKRDRREEADNKVIDGLEIDDDVPTEEEIDRLEEDLENAKSEQKNLFLIIFQRFIIMLSNHIANSEIHRQDVNTLWFKWALDRLRQVFLQHHEVVRQYNNTLETLLFTSDIDFHILAVFNEFQAMRG
ncbi:nuclear cap-binding protein subunit 1-like [Watersipora subatra]|uniref:nuclear cap-binding protein subunit 1-like n=1 Tax=Watersipora subatra TaxID=2589382 RepID=UPI00355B67AA